MDMESPQTIMMMIISTLTSLPSSHSHSISALLLRRRRRLAAILSSPPLFSLTLLYLQSLSLHHKSLLIAHHLLSTLTFLKSLTTTQNNVVSLPDHLDSALLLILLCDVDHHDRHLLDAPLSQWRQLLCKYVSESVLRVSSLGGGGAVEFVEEVGRCWNLVHVMCWKEEVTAATVAVKVVEVVKEGVECAICKEEMMSSGEVCELVCRHLFHWRCIVKWFKKRSTCPCCRRRMPAGDVQGEIRRVLEELAEIGSAVIEL